MQTLASQKRPLKDRHEFRDPLSLHIPFAEQQTGFSSLEKGKEGFLIE